MSFISVQYGSCGPYDCQPSLLYIVAIRDVKTVYFSEPVTGLPKPFLPVTERPIVSGIIVTVAPRLLSVDCLSLHGGGGPHSRRTDADAAKQDSGVSKQ